MRLRQSKFGNKPTFVEGIRFASKKEARRYQDLRILEKAGKIANLQRQVRFPLGINGNLICTYIADFTYRQVDELGYLKPVVEDCKGYRTREYTLKKKMMWAIHRLEIKET